MTLLEIEKEASKATDVSKVAKTSIGIDQSEIEAVILNPLFNAWLQEAVLIEGYLPPAARTLSARFTPTWQWDVLEDIDPNKEANAAQTRLQTGNTTMAIECGVKGLDWNDVFVQQAKEIARAKELGLPNPYAPKPIATAQTAPEPDEPPPAKRGK